MARANGARLPIACSSGLSAGRARRRRRQPALRREDEWAALAPEIALRRAARGAGARARTGWTWSAALVAGAPPGDAAGARARCEVGGQGQGAVAVGGRCRERPASSDRRSRRATSPASSALYVESTSARDAPRTSQTFERCIAVGGVGALPRRHRLRARLRARLGRGGRAAPLRAQGPPARQAGRGHVLPARARARRAARAAGSRRAARSSALLPGGVTLLLPEPGAALPARLRGQARDARSPRPSPRRRPGPAGRRQLAGPAVQRQQRPASPRRDASRTSTRAHARRRRPRPRRRRAAGNALHGGRPHELRDAMGRSRSCARGPSGGTVWRRCYGPPDDRSEPRLLHRPSPRSIRRSPRCSSTSSSASSARSR